MHRNSHDGWVVSYAAATKRFEVSSFSLDEVQSHSDTRWPKWGITASPYLHTVRMSVPGIR